MIIDHSQMEDVESGMRAGRGVIADEESRITLGGIGDGQYVHTVSAPASTAVHVRQSTSAGRQLWRHVGDVIDSWSKSHPLTSSYTRVYNISRVRSGKSSTTNEAKTVQQAGTWKTGKKCEDKKAQRRIYSNQIKFICDKKNIMQHKKTKQICRQDTEAVWNCTNECPTK